MAQGKKKTVSKSASRSKQPSHTADTKEVAVESTQHETPHTTPVKMRSSNKPFIIALVVLGIAILFFLLRNHFIVASVNGQMITRYDLLRELEKQGGKQTVDSMITQILIRQEAKKKGITVADDELATEMMKIEQQASSSGQTFDELLATYGTTREEVTEEIRLQKLVEKLVGESVTVTDEELNAFIEENKQFLPEEGATEQAKEEARNQLKSQKVSTEAQTMIEELKKNANIQYFLELK